MSNRCKNFYFISFLLTFGGWQGNHFGPNFMENNSIENFEAWKSRESDENYIIRCASKFSLIVVQIDRIGLFFGDLKSKLRYDIDRLSNHRVVCSYRTPCQHTCVLLMPVSVFALSLSPREGGAQGKWSILETVLDVENDENRMVE